MPGGRPSGASTLADQDVGCRIDLPDDRLERLALFGGNADRLEKGFPRPKIQHNLPDLVSFHGPLDLEPLTTGANHHATIPAIA